MMVVMNLVMVELELWENKKEDMWIMLGKGRMVSECGVLCYLVCYIILVWDFVYYLLFNNVVKNCINVCILMD